MNEIWEIVKKETPPSPWIMAERDVRYYRKICCLIAKAACSTVNIGLFYNFLGQLI